MIIGDGEHLLKLDARFNDLTHLELQDVFLDNSPILKSPNLTHLGHIGCQFFSGDYSTLKETDDIVTLSGISTLECKLKHLNVFCALNKVSFEYCKKHNKFSELERLDCQVREKCF